MKPETKTNKSKTALVLIALLVYGASLSAQETNIPESNLPDVEEISKAESDLKFKTITEIDTNFFPGIRLCEEDEVDYRNGARKVNCQDPELIEAVSTRNPNLDHNPPNTIVNDRVQPNGNILRINFGRVLVPETSTTDN